MALAFVFIEKHASNQKPTMPYKSDAKHVIDATHSKLNLIIPMFKKCTFLSDFFLSTPNGCVQSVYLDLKPLVFAT